MKNVDLIEQDLDLDASDYDFENILPTFSRVDSITDESICQADNRMKQIDTLALPYKAICKLYMKAANGDNLIGTGFLTHSNKLYTAGHCVFSQTRGGWMRSITVVPGKSGLREPFGRYKAVRVYAASEWVNSGSVRYDMGAIKLSQVVSHSDFIDVTTADANEATVCGYPGDRDQGLFQYRMRDSIRKSAGRFRYQIDTYGGQSGAPLMKNSSVAIGIHNYGGCDNAASDLTPDFINKIENW
jgi:V8-like Glu-specific endopeptidase